MQKRKQNKQRKNAMRLNEALGPRQFRANPEISHQYRFTSTAGTAKTITGLLLGGACGVSARTAILGDLMFQMVKVKRVEIWSPPASQGAAVTCSILWPISNSSQPREVSDTTVSTARPAHVVSSPPPLSLASFWTSASSGTNLFTLVAPSGSVIDVWVSLVLGDGPNGGAGTVTLVGATIGGQYYCSLDSGTAAGSIYLPVSLTTA